MNEMLERERVDEDEGASMLIRGEVETERLSISMSDMLIEPLETEMSVEDRETIEEEGVNEREYRVRVPDMVFLTNIPSEERKSVKLEMDTSDDPERVNAVEVRETIRPVLDRPEMERGVDVVKEDATAAVLNVPFKRTIDFKGEFSTVFTCKAWRMDKHGISFHPHVLLSTPSDAEDI